MGKPKQHDLESWGFTSSKQKNNCKPVSKRKPKNVEYSKAEDILIIRKLLKASAFEYTRGRKLWILLAKSEAFKGKRSADSLENRYARYIKPGLWKDGACLVYKVGPEELDQIRKIEYKLDKNFMVGNGKHSNSSLQCPDYVF